MDEIVVLADQRIQPGLVARVARLKSQDIVALTSRAHMSASVSAGLSSDELAICTSMGIAPGDFLATKDAGADAGHYGLTDVELAVCKLTGTRPKDFSATKANASTVNRHGLSDDELAICTATGTKPEAFAATKRRLG